MKTNNVILTIAIPTYNRSHHLKKCLDHLVSQVNGEVCLLVQDNNSNNYDFLSFIAPYVEKYGIIAKQNKSNIGGDANIARIFEECKTKWLWVIGDDDYVKPDAVKMVLNNIKECDKDIIYIKYNSKNNLCTKGLDGFATAMKPFAEFAYSFFTSECIYNLTDSQEDLYWHYRLLSLRCAQILRILKHLERVPNSKCLFSTKQVLCNHGSDISWSRGDFVKNYLCIFDVFYNNRALFEDNISRDIIRVCLVYIDSSQMSFQEKLYYYRLCICRYGFFNTVTKCTRQVLRIPLRHFLPSSLYAKLSKI